ncbi:MAG: DUF3536 domain-containing protein [Actinobacteria bacterium]|nr:DUF3536 domain-containing protein [Actinomycetota bacterium]MBW3649878.1 DUF3536 domain-containing protein [Actinomycetota bacterium]
MSLPPALALHGHFYQPPRENPWTEEVPREPSAAPFHDWNERIALECYRPNAFARVLDERGRVVSIVNNYEHLSFDFGPTLLSWLDEHEPEAYRRVLEADRRGGGAIAQTYFHVILPLATERDVRTQVRWGLAEFSHRFGRRAEGMWLPETAVNDMVLRVLAEEGVSFTVLAPTQAAGRIDTHRPYRWSHPEQPARGVNLVFYDGGLAHAVAFELKSLTSQAFLDRVQATSSAGGLLAVAADGETFGHHHHWGDRLIAYALAVEAPKRGIEVTNIANFLRDNPPIEPMDVVESAWSCAHGVGRWKEDCGCSTGSQGGWNQRWRAPLRAALDVVRDAVDEVFERRGREVLRDPWAARDEYVQVLLGAETTEAFAARHVIAENPVVALTLLEAQRHSLAMYTSCGWFFDDLAGLEAVQVLRYAARAMDCLQEVGEEPPLSQFLDVLATAQSNVVGEGDGRDVWVRHVVPARVDAERVVAHLALIELLEGREPAKRVAMYDVEVAAHGVRHRGALSLCWGRVSLTHRRTGRRSSHVYAALHLGGLEVLGATRRANGEQDPAVLTWLQQCFAEGAPVTTLLRLVSDGFGPREFGLRSALPDAADQFLHGAARDLADRLAGAYSRLFSDNRPMLATLAAAGYQLPPELRAPAELALARRLEEEVAAQGGSLDPADYTLALAVAAEAEASGVVLNAPQAQATFDRLFLTAVGQAVRDPRAVHQALGVLHLARRLGLHPDLCRPQEVVWEAITAGGAEADAQPDPELRRLADALGVAT